ncbi:hypothetical protein RZ50_027370 [Kitasatospora sp. SUK 42]|nr:hypothetical protein [Kitasatospora sp. SUK 42]
MAGGTAIWATGLSGTASAAPAAEPAAAPRSAAGTTGNGWPVIDQAATQHLEGAYGVEFAVRDGDAATLLTHLARRYHYEIRTLAAGDVTGHTAELTTAAPYESNYRSGTAIAILPRLYPAGASGGFFSNELTVIRDILADLEGTVKWGGDEALPKESHFQIDLPPNDPRVRKVAAKIRQWNDSPGKGAGASDPLAPGRLQAARALTPQGR